MKNRIIVGAHYGLQSWLVQRISAFLLAILSVGFLWALICSDGSYTSWKSLMSMMPARIGAVIFFGLLSVHAWVGIRDIWMDYIKPTWLRLLLHIVSIVFLLICFLFALFIFWS